MYDVTARRHAQHPDGKPVNVGKPTPVAAKAAAIDAAQARPLTWKSIVKRALAVAVAGAALYVVLPGLIKVLGEWPRLSTLNPAWFTVCLAAELASFTCNFALQRLALRTKGWLPLVTAGLTGNAVTNSLPGGSAAGAAVQFHMLTTAGFDTDTAVGGLTAFSLLEVGGLLALPIFALPAILAGVPVSRGLVHAAAAGIVALFPLTPGGLGIVEASLSGLLILAGVRGGYAYLATLAYRIASYWLPLLAGPPAYLLFRHRYRRPIPRHATPGEAGSNA